MIRRPPRSTLDRSSAASDVYKRQGSASTNGMMLVIAILLVLAWKTAGYIGLDYVLLLSLIHISEPTRPY